MTNFRGSQPCISMNFCTVFSKAQVFPCVYRYVYLAVPNSRTLKKKSFNSIQHLKRLCELFLGPVLVSESLLMQLLPP